jgi:hypothetical protein
LDWIVSSSLIVCLMILIVFWLRKTKTH